MKSVTCCLVLVLLVSPAFASINQFQAWYSEYRRIFQKILREDCSEEHAFFLAGQSNPERFDKDQWSGATHTSQVVFPLASCILNHCSEWMKANMAAAAVLLGLTPTILAAIAPSIEESSSIFIIARRPLLGLCLAAGIPSLYPFQTLEYKRAIKLLQVENLWLERSRNAPPAKQYRQYMISGIEFTVVVGAIVNNATNSYQLGMQTVCVVAPQIWYLPIVWVFLGVFSHLFGAWALWTRIGCTTPNQKGSGWLGWLGWLKKQFSPHSERYPLVVKAWPDSWVSVGIHWWASIYIVAHILLGSLTFSSLLFITVRDALAVVGRYMISLLFCRIVLTYELGLLRQQFAGQSRPSVPIRDEDVALRSLQ
jgi:hypothetical protein